MKDLSLFTVALLLCIGVYAQDKKTYNIERTSTPPTIDGVLNDAVWETVQVATDFVQFRPDVGNLLPENKKTTVKMAYNDDAIFISAHLKDDSENMMRQFTQRDNFGQSDFFGIIFNPNNDAQNDTEFFVFSSGTQADAVASPSNGEDFGWNAVWESAVQVVDDGWTVEVKIPYSALRFTQQEDPTWGIQFHRHFRKNRSQYTWNPLDPTKGNIGLYHAELKGLKNLQPPTRLSFYPFASAVVDKFDGETNEDYNFGLDIKYGITENFTLDATLIPDFSQAAFDNVELNLGPFEQRFSEQRQFFTEGVDLFGKGNLFYSRRIGNAPSGSVDLDDNEQIDGDYPKKVNTLNAVKVSGRTKNGLGIGFFNAITEKTKANVINTDTGEKRSEVVEPLANYNIFVLDQQFNKNSSISLINTNVTRSGHFRDANVTGLLLDLVNKKNTYGLVAEAKMSSLNLVEGNRNGFSSRFGFGKNSGKYRFSVEHELADKKYDINDMGILFRNNYSSFRANGSYRIFEPTKTLNEFRINVNANANYLYKPNTYTGKNFNTNFFAVHKKSLMAFGGFLGVRPGKQYDYFGPREDGRYFISEDWINGNLWMSSDYNKTLALDARIGYETLFEKGRDYSSYFFRLAPRLKLKDKFVMTYSFEYDTELKERGYVTTNDSDIIYGQRDQITIENSISANYNFNSFHGLVLSFRNYWASVQYENELFALEENGRINKEDGYTKGDVSDPDVNFSTWNLNLTYSWQFAPGSQFTAQYRNRIFNSNNNGTQSYNDSLSDLFNEPIGHTFSLRMVYFIDYNNLKNVFKSKSKTI